MGWICCVIGLSVSLAVAPIEYGHYALAHPGSLPAAATLAWPAMWAYYPALGLMAIFLLLLFPTGQLPSRRWRPVAWAAGATITSMTLAAAVAPVPPDDGLPTNPLGIQQLAWAWELTESIGALLFGALAVASAASLVARFRHARGEERQQLKWFSFGTGGLVVLLAVQAAAPTLGARVPNLVVAAALGAIPLAIGIAILRYRLYDIDRIINRTLVYGLLTAVLGAATPARSSCLASCSAVWGSAPPAGRWPASPWPWPRCSSRPAAASKRWWIGASTAASTTRPRPSRRTRPACASRSTSTPSRPSSLASLTRPWSRPGSRCGFAPPYPAPRAHPAVRHGQLPGPTELIIRHLRPVLVRLLKCQNTSATEHYALPFLVILAGAAVTQRRLGPSSSATTSTTCRALPSSPVRLRC